MKTFIASSNRIKALNDAILIQLQTIIMRENVILIGDCRGADTAVQQYLADMAYPDVTVYASGYSVHCNIGGWNVRHIPAPNDVTGYEFYRQKDYALAKDADCGLILWDGKSKATKDNFIRLVEQNKPATLIFIPEGQNKSDTVMEAIS